MLPGEYSSQKVKCKLITRWIIGTISHPINSDEIMTNVALSYKDYGFKINRSCLLEIFHKLITNEYPYYFVGWGQEYANCLHGHWGNSPPKRGHMFSVPVPTSLAYVENQVSIYPFCLWYPLFFMYLVQTRHLPTFLSLVWTWPMLTPCSLSSANCNCLLFFVSSTNWTHLFCCVCLVQTRAQNNRKWLLCHLKQNWKFFLIF